MKQKKLYFWMYVILGYFILTLVLGIPSLFSSERTDYILYIFGDTGFLLDLVLDIILMIILLPSVIGMIFKYKWAWGLSLSYMCLIIISSIVASIITIIMPGKVLSGIESIQGIEFPIPQKLFILIVVIVILAQLTLFGLIGRYIYKNRSYFKR